MVSDDDHHHHQFPQQMQYVLLPPMTTMTSSPLDRTMFGTYYPINSLLVVARWWLVMDATIEDKVIIFMKKTNETVWFHFLIHKCHHNFNILKTYKHSSFYWSQMWNIRKIGMKNIEIMTTGVDNLMNYN